MKQENSDNSQKKWESCVVCNLVDQNTNVELNAFISEISKKNPMPVIVNESIIFLNLLLKTRVQKNKNEDMNFDRNDMLKHIRFCVASRDSTLRMLIARNEIMDFLLDSASGTKEKTQALGLLLKTNTSES